MKILIKSLQFFACKLSQGAASIFAVSSINGKVQLLGQTRLPIGSIALAIESFLIMLIVKA